MVEEPAEWDEVFIAAQAARLSEIAARRGRYLLGIAGIPGSGKSTLAEQLWRQVEKMTPGVARLVPMDGFHLTNRRLDELGLRDRKGAPHTFDSEGLVKLLRAARDPTRTIRFLVYDRRVHEPVMTGREEQVISPRTRLVITEGNYLLMNREPWRRIRLLLDESWWLQTPLEIAKRRLIARRIHGGCSRQQAQTLYEGNDALNARLVRDESVAADLIVRSCDERGSGRYCRGLE